MHKYHGLPSLPEGEDLESPMLAGAEGYEWGAPANLDLFLTRLYRYWAGKGLRAQVLSGALNLFSLAFTIAFSGFLLLGVDWHALLTAPCIAQDTCDIWHVALIRNPLASRGIVADILILLYLAVFGSYWAWSALHYITDVRDMMEARHWVSNKLGIPDSKISLMTWAELLHKLVVLQRTTRLCMARDLNEHDIVSRIMRKDNYLIALLNKGSLKLTPPPVTAVTGMAGCAAARATARAMAIVLGAVADISQPPETAHATEHHQSGTGLGLELRPEQNGNGWGNGDGAQVGMQAGTAGDAGVEQLVPLMAGRDSQPQSSSWRQRPAVLAVCRGCRRASVALHGWVDGPDGAQGGRRGRLPSWLASAGRGTLLGGRRPLMTKTLEWNLKWCVLDYMFDEQFCVKKEFLEQPDKLKQRLRMAAVINALISPFLLMFLLLYFFLRNAERFYHHPGSAGSRRWSALARWHLREFNELPHYIAHRLDSAYAPACHYVQQFPSHTIASVARFVAFVAGSFTALFLLLTLLDERLLERPLLGRHLVWWLATLGVVLTASRGFINEEPVAYDPERAMQEVVVHTHYLPRHWRGRAHTAEVQAAFNQLFQFKILLFLEELASVVLTPFMLYVTLPQCADDIVQFVADFTVHVEGVGDVCSLACFDLQAHGNPKYGAPAMPGGPVRKAVRSRQGKLEKSLLTFMATYPTWEPGPDGKAMLWSLSQQQQSNALNPMLAPPDALYATPPGSLHAAMHAGPYPPYTMPLGPYPPYLYPQHMPHPYHIPVGSPDRYSNVSMQSTMHAAMPSQPQMPPYAAAAPLHTAGTGFPSPHAAGPPHAGTMQAATGSPRPQQPVPTGQPLTQQPSLATGLALQGLGLPDVDSVLGKVVAAAGAHAAHTAAVGNDAVAGPQMGAVDLMPQPLQLQQQPTAGVLEPAPTFDLGSLDEWEGNHQVVEPVSAAIPSANQEEATPGAERPGPDGSGAADGAGGWSHTPEEVHQEQWGLMAASLHHSVFGAAPPPMFDLTLSGAAPANVHEGVVTVHPSDAATQQLPGVPTATNPLFGTSSVSSSTHGANNPLYESGTAAGGDGQLGQLQGGLNGSAVWVSDPAALLLPTNETHDLTHRLAVGHSVLQGLYERRDPTVQHRSMARIGAAMMGSMVMAPGGTGGSSMWAAQGAMSGVMQGAAWRQPGRGSAWGGSHMTHGASSMHPSVQLYGSRQSLLARSQHGSLGARAGLHASRGPAQGPGRGRAGQSRMQHSGMLHHYGGVHTVGGGGGSRGDLSSTHHHSSDPWDHY